MTAIFTIILSISLIVVLFFFTNNIVSTFAENSIDNSQGDWTKYINQRYGFSLEYPSSWVIK
jgi:hypothetical protein